MKEADFEPDEEQTADRTPAACPHCGQTGSFDGNGGRNQVTSINDGDGWQQFELSISQFHCPECNGRFSMIDRAVEQ